MHLPLSTGIVTGLLLLLMAPSAEAGSCTPRHARPHGCPAVEPARNVDLKSVPDISKSIVLDEPAITAKRKELQDPSPEAGYTGPTAGVVQGMGRAATVGYHWALQ
jgi:hypothetical protein